MNALLRRKREWEYHNEQYLLRLVETSVDVSVESVKKAGLVTSFLLYILYKVLEIVFALAALMFVGPKLRRRISPGHHEDLERHSPQMEFRSQNPFLKI